MASPSSSDPIPARVYARISPAKPSSSQSFRQSATGHQAGTLGG
jgi:hypothetical protein